MKKIKNLNTSSKKHQLLRQELNSLTSLRLSLQSKYHDISTSKAFRLWRVFHEIKKKPKIIIKSFEILLKKGPAGLFASYNNHQSVDEKLVIVNDHYKIWLQKNWLTKDIIKKQVELQKLFHYRPKISIITPVYNPEKKWLERCLDSVINQSYDNWELCLADDKSTKEYVKEVLEKYRDSNSKIKVVFRKTNGHISNASNSALEIANGDYVTFLDHDDELTPNALYETVKFLNNKPQADLIYSDEDMLDTDGNHINPFFKPDWSPDMFLSTNYFCHLCVIKKSLVDRVGGFRIGYEGSQDYDLFLRISEITKNIFHIPKILYSWRKTSNSTALDYSIKAYANSASINALSDHLNRQKISGTVENGIVEGSFRVKYKIIGNPLVSIVIATKDKVEYLKRCIRSLLSKTTYSNYEIIIIDTGSTDKNTFKYYEELKSKSKIKIVKWNLPFNYSSVNNFGVEHAKGEYLLLLNNDTEIISPDWIESMLEHAQRKDVGAVGAKLLYPDNRIQHAGVIIGLGGVAGHAQKMFEDLHYIPMLWNKDLIRNYSAVTAACLMISKNKYLAVNGLDSIFKIAFNDVDFCLKLQKKGLLNVYTPYAKLYHHESVSVGKPETGTRDIAGFQKEIQLMRTRWQTHIKKDPFYNVNLTLTAEDYSIKN